MKHWAILLLGALAACASGPPAAVEYLLRPPLEEIGGGDERVPYAALGRIMLAPYLARDGIVVETGDHRIQAARGHLWAEPLSRSLRRMLQVGIGRASGRAVADTQAGAADHEVVIDVDIHRLHGSLQGAVAIAAEWRLRETSTNRMLGRHELVHSTLTTEPGYDALVQAHISLLEALSEAIAESLEAPNYLAS